MKDDKPNLFILIGIILMLISYIILGIYHGHNELVNMSYQEMEEASKIIW